MLFICIITISGDLYECTKLALAFHRYSYQVIMIKYVCGQ